MFNIVHNTFHFRTTKLHQTLFTFFRRASRLKPQQPLAAQRTAAASMPFSRSSRVLRKLLGRDAGALVVEDGGVPGGDDRGDVLPVTREQAFPKIQISRPPLHPDCVGSDDRVTEGLVETKICLQDATV